MLKIRLNNYEKGLKALKENQKATKSPSVWAQIDEEIKHFESIIEDLKCQIKKNSAET